MPGTDTALDLRDFILDVPDFPKKGILFKDITPLLGNAAAFKAAVERLCEPFMRAGVQKVAGIESRGFLLATAVAYRLGAGVIPIRKKGKLPRSTIQETFTLEYGSDCVEAHSDAASPQERLLLIDDVLATGGTAAASCKLLESLKARIVGIGFLIELNFLKGRDKLGSRAVHSLIRY